VDDEIESSGVEGREVSADDAVLGGGIDAVNLIKGILPQMFCIAVRSILVEGIEEEGKEIELS